jgi:hypothetical protein
MANQRVVFSYGENEYLPLICVIGHNLKEENVCIAEVIEEKIDELTRTLKMRACIKNKNIEIFSKYLNDGNFWRFSEGFLDLDKKKIPINNYRRYASLQIDGWCYDNIDGIRLQCNLFDDTQSTSL